MRSATGNDWVPYSIQVLGQTPDGSLLTRTLIFVDNPGQTETRRANRRRVRWTPQQVFDWQASAWTRSH